MEERFYNPGKNLVEKFAKISKIGLSLEKFGFFSRF